MAVAAQTFQSLRFSQSHVHKEMVFGILQQRTELLGIVDSPGTPGGVLHDEALQGMRQILTPIVEALLTFKDVVNFKGKPRITFGEHGSTLDAPNPAGSYDLLEAVPQWKPYPAGFRPILSHEWIIPFLHEVIQFFILALRKGERIEGT